MRAIKNGLRALGLLPRKSLTFERLPGGGLAVEQPYGISMAEFERQLNLLSKRMSCAERARKAEIDAMRVPHR